jgi:hypothetical protein
MGNTESPCCDTSLHNLSAGTSLSVKSGEFPYAYLAVVQEGNAGVAERGAIQWEGSMWIRGKVRKR